MFWINGKAARQLELTDRAIQFGDGCFTTARVRDGQIDWLPQYLQRLQEATNRLRITGTDWLALEQEMHIAARYRAEDEGVVKTIITRGAGGRGYGSTGCGQPTRIVMLTEAPPHYAHLRESGVRLMLSSVRLALNPLLAGIKHLNRLEQVLIRMELEQHSADEALVLDTEGKLVECCAANVFWRKGKRLFTPALEGAGVDGIMRRRVLTLAKQYDYDCRQVRVGPEVLERADEIFICNALMPLLPVNNIDNGRCYTSRELYLQLLTAC